MSIDPVIRAADAEIVDSPPHLITLLADGGSRGRSFGIIRVPARQQFPRGLFARANVRKQVRPHQPTWLPTDR